MNFIPRIFLFALLLITACAGQEDDVAGHGHHLRLPGALQSLSTCQGIQSLDQLEVRTAITGGILDPRTLKLSEQKDGTIVANADFELDGVTSKRTESFALGIYGRMSTEDEWVLLATLEEDITLKPNEVNSPSLDAPFQDGCGNTYNAKTGAIDTEVDTTACVLSADLNRNNRSNLDDFCSGALPTAPGAFLNINPSTVQFQSGIELGQFARQVVLLENLSDRAITLNAEVVGMPGLTIARLDPEFFEIDGTARREIENSEDAPFQLEPLSEMLVALSYAPVNGFLATGNLQVSAANAINVSQALDITVIGNTDGTVQGVNPDYEVTSATASLAEQLGLPLTPYPAEYLFSGLSFSGGNVDVQPDAKIEDFPVDAAYLFEVPPEYRFSLSLTGLASDMDLGLFILNSDNEVTESIFSQNAGTSSEAVEWRNEGEEAVNAVLAISKVVENRETESNDGALTVFQAFFGDDATSGNDGDATSNQSNNDTDNSENINLTAQLFAGPEFAEETPLSPVTGPYEGGATITLQGRGFQQGASVTVNDSYAFDVQVLNEGTEVRFTLPPATGGASTEPVTVVLINPPASETFPDGDGQAATLAESFTYLPPRPVLLSVSPNKASVDGGTSVTLSGSYMSSTHGVPAVCFGTQLVSEENISFTNSAEILVTSPEWEGVSPGEEETVNLTVRNWLVNAVLLETTPTSLEICSDDALTSLSGFSNQLAFTFKAAEAEAPVPFIDEVTPSNGSIDGDEPITIRGSNFANDAIVYFGTKPATSITRINAEELSVRSPAGDEDGIVDVSVVNVDDATTSNSKDFLYETPEPLILSVLPNTGTTVAENTIAIEGSNFRTSEDGNYPAVTFSSSENTYAAVSTQFLNSGRVLATAPANMETGFYAVQLENPNGDTANGGTNNTLEIQAPVAPAPVIDLITPSSGSVVGGNTVEIRGANFDVSETPTILVNGKAVVEIIENDADSIQFVMPTSEDAGLVTLRLVNSDGQSDTVTYTYLQDVADPPLLDSVSSTMFVVGDADATLTAEFTQIQIGYRLTVSPNLSQGGFSSLVDGRLTYVHSDPCVDGEGPYVLQVSNPDFQSVAVGYYCAQENLPAPSLGTINETLFEEGETQELSIDFYDVLNGAVLDVRYGSDSAAFVNISNNDLSDDRFNYSTNNPCSLGAGLYQAHLQNPDGKSVSVPYLCEPWAHPEVTSQSKYWVYTHSGGDKIRLTGFDLDRVELIGIQEAGNPASTNTLCGGSQQSACDNDSDVLSITTSDSLTPNQEYQIVLSWTMPGDNNEVEQWLSEPIIAQAPTIDATMDSSGGTLRGLDLVVTGAHLNAESLPNSSCQLYWFDSQELQMQQMMAMTGEGNEEGDSDEGGSVGNDADDGDEGDSAGDAGPVTSENESDGGVGSEENGNSSADAGVSEDASEEFVLSNEDFHSYCGCSVQGSNDNVLTLTTVKEECRLVPGMYYATLSYPNGHSISTNHFSNGESLSMMMFLMASESNSDSQLEVEYPLEYTHPVSGERKQETLTTEALSTIPEDITFCGADQRAIAVGMDGGDDFFAFLLMNHINTFEIQGLYSTIEDDSGNRVALMASTNGDFSCDSAETSFTAGNATGQVGYIFEGIPAVEGYMDAGQWALQKTPNLTVSGSPEFNIATFAQNGWEGEDVIHLSGDSVVPAAVCGTDDLCDIYELDETGQEPQWVLSAIQAFVTDMITQHDEFGSEEDRLVLELTAAPKDGTIYRLSLDSDPFDPREIDLGTFSSKGGGEPTFCGDGHLEYGEDCDHGEQNGQGCYAQSPAQSCDACAINCTYEWVQATEYCGDGIRYHEEEECDRGTATNGALYYPSDEGHDDYDGQQCDDTCSLRPKLGQPYPHIISEQDHLLIYGLQMDRIYDHAMVICDKYDETACEDKSVWVTSEHELILYSAGLAEGDYVTCLREMLPEGVACDTNLPPGVFLEFTVQAGASNDEDHQPNLSGVTTHFMPEGTVWGEVDVVIETTGEHLSHFNIDDENAETFHIFEIQKHDCDAESGDMVFSSRPNESPRMELAPYNNDTQLEVRLPVADQATWSVSPDDHLYLCVFEQTNDGTETIFYYEFQTLYPRIDTLMPSRANYGDTILIHTQGTFDFDLDQLMLCPNNGPAAMVISSEDPFAVNILTESVCHTEFPTPATIGDGLYTLQLPDQESWDAEQTEVALCFRRNGGAIQDDCRLFELGDEPTGALLLSLDVDSFPINTPLANSSFHLTAIGLGDLFDASQHEVQIQEATGEFVPVENRVFAKGNPADIPSYYRLETHGESGNNEVISSEHVRFDHQRTSDALPLMLYADIDEDLPGTDSCSSLQFDGNDTRVTVPQNADLQPTAGSYSFSVTFKAGNTDGNHILADFHNNVRAQLTSGGMMHMEFGSPVQEGGDCDITINTPIALNTWTTLTAVWDEGNPTSPGQLYVDGVPFTNEVVSDACEPDTSWGGITFGDDSTSDNSNNFSGHIDEISFWDDALSAAETFDLPYDGGKLVARWEFSEDGDDSSIAVAAPDDYNGSVSGSTNWKADTCRCNDEPSNCFEEGGNASLTGRLYTMQTRVITSGGDGGSSTSEDQWKIIFVDESNGFDIEQLTHPHTFSLENGFFFGDETFADALLQTDTDGDSIIEADEYDTDINYGFNRSYPDFLSCGVEGYDDITSCALAAATTDTINGNEIDLPAQWTLHKPVSSNPFVGWVDYRNQDQLEVILGSRQQLTTTESIERTGLSVRLCGDTDCGFSESSTSRLGQGYVEGIEAVFGAFITLYTDMGTPMPVGDVEGYLPGVDQVCATSPVTTVTVGPELGDVTWDVADGGTLGYDGTWQKLSGSFDYEQVYDEVEGRPIYQSTYRPEADIGSEGAPDYYYSYAKFFSGEGALCTDCWLVLYYSSHALMWKFTPVTAATDEMLAPTSTDWMGVTDSDFTTISVDVFNAQSIEGHDSGYGLHTPQQDAQFTIPGEQAPSFTNITITENEAGYDIHTYAVPVNQSIPGLFNVNIEDEAYSYISGYSGAVDGFCFRARQDSDPCSETSCDGRTVVTPPADGNGYGDEGSQGGFVIGG